MITEPTPRREELYARPECPQPGRWSAPDGVATETDVSALLGALVRALKPDLVVETGSYLGHTTEAIGRALAAEGRGALISYEVAADRAASVRQRCIGLPVTVSEQDSRTAVFVGRIIDLLFLDSEYEARVEEIVRFREWASPRCVLVAHDTVVDDYRRALDRLAELGKTTPWLYLPTPRGLGLARYR